MSGANPHSPIRVLAGARAAQVLASEGLRAGAVAGVAAAAGGPKGLALIDLDRFLFGQWLPGAPRHRALHGASIGAWRMAAAAQRDPLAALDRLEHAYLEGQRYPLRPASHQVSRVCREVVRDTIAHQAARFLQDIDPSFALHLVTARARPGPPGSTRRLFSRAALANTLSRERLGSHLQRVVFHTAGALAGQCVPDDAFDTRQVPLRADNLEDALLASGSIPLVADPVRSIAGGPIGDYWDGGLIDYHLVWPYHRLDGLVLIPHFAPHLTAGWLDKFLPWRRHGERHQASGWLDNVVVIAPSPWLLARLPAARLPERQDFRRFGLDHDRRIAQWRRAIDECRRITDGFVEFCRDPARHGWEALGTRVRASA